MVAFLIAGFETTNSAFNFCCYMMAKHPEELKKLQDEVDATFKDTNASFCAPILFFAKEDMVILEILVSISD